MTITGKNDQGKSSVLDAIWYTLAGKGVICEEPVRKGQKFARSFVDLKVITVERRYSSVTGESTLTVRNANGVVKSPQAMLDSLCNLVGFDPLSFVRMKPLEQVETLRQLVGLDFTALEAKKKKAYDDRTLAGRELDRAKAKLTDAPLDASAPDKEVSVAELSRRLDIARAANHTYRQATQKRDFLKSEFEQLNAQRRLLEQQLANVIKAIEVLAPRFESAENELAGLTPADEVGTARQIAESEAINTRVRANIRHHAIQAEITGCQNTVDRLTFELESIEEEKRDQLMFAKFPLDGLSFDDNRVLLNGVPFGQASQARQLQAAVAIGLALNPKLRVILVHDGSLLDDDSMALMKEMAVKNDAQIWIEYVNSKDSAAIVIEDGEVKA